MEEKYIYRMGKKLRCGFTTGSCAQAAAKAAALYLFTGIVPKECDIVTPDGTNLNLPVEEAERYWDGEKNAVCGVCAVRKDGGDDSDVTTGMLVYAKVWISGTMSGESVPESSARELPGESVPGDSARERSGESVSARERVRILGGVGVGRVTKAGLDQPVGEAAINSVPRKMIRAEVLKVLEEEGEDVCVCVEIFIPDGEALAKKTFNERLGIIGGLSILGTTGIVEPMSEKAMVDTIRAELSIRKHQRDRELLITPGNFGMQFLADSPLFSAENAVKCSNFIGDTLDMAADFGFEKVTLVGHIGKLVKLAGGLLNTHSMYGDCRMEILCACGLEAGADRQALLEILRCVTCDEALSILERCGVREKAMERLGEKIMFHLNYRCKGKLQLEVIVFSNVYGVLIHRK